MSLPPDARSTYVAFGRRDERRAHKHRLVREVKRLIELVAHLDSAAADPGTLDTVRDALHTLGDRLAGQPSLLATGGLGAQSGSRPRCSSAAASAVAATHSPRRCSGR